MIKEKIPLFYVCTRLPIGKILRGGYPFTDVSKAHDAAKRNHKTSPHLEFWVEDENGLKIEDNE